jgi:hypothetical protein
VTRDEELNLDHPCKQTCSGWTQGYERGAAFERKRSEGLVKALESYAHLPDGRFNGPDDIYEDLGDTARKALKQWNGE